MYRSVEISPSLMLQRVSKNGIADNGLQLHFSDFNSPATDVCVNVNFILGCILLISSSSWGSCLVVILRMEKISSKKRLKRIKAFSCHNYISLLGFVWLYLLAQKMYLHRM